MNLLIRVPGIERSRMILVGTILLGFALAAILDHYVTGIMQRTTSAQEAVVPGDAGSSSRDLRAM